MAFTAVTILMDTLHQHFLLPTPRFPLRNKTKVNSLYKNLSSLRTFLEQDFKVGEKDEAFKALEALMRDVSVELRFQIEEQLRLFYLGKAMRLRLHSAQKLLRIVKQPNKHEETIDSGSVFDILAKHFTLPVSRMPARIKKRVKSFCTENEFLLCKEIRYGDNLERYYNEQEDGDEQKLSNVWEIDLESLLSSIEQDTENYRRTWNILYEAESIIRQELRASYLQKYMKQWIQAIQRIRQLFVLGIKLTSYINKELLKVKNAYHQLQNNNTASLRGPERDNVMIADSLQHTSESTIKIVGYDDEFNTIMDKLNKPSSKLEIVSIVGMGGIGKTTLARKIYEDASFISSFYCQAWVTISQEYNPKKAFKGLLHSLVPGNYEKEELDYYLTAVYRHLKHQRYLIIVDDIWCTDVWDDLMRVLQDDNTGSRILLTTRLKSVAEYACPSTNFCHSMRFLDSYESWNLFHNKVSERMILPAEFEKIGREIVKKCKGLPLAISVVAGLLSNSKQDLKEWERIAKNVPTLSLNHSIQQGENIIDLSYTFLPHHLRLCFLSFGCFPEDEEVSENAIVDFWVSEGFLKVWRCKGLEDVARECLQDLVDRNLVLFCGKRNRGSSLFKAYKMHDILRELALKEAEKENLLCFKEGCLISLRYKRIRPINSSPISQPWSVLSRICNYNGITPTTNTSSLINHLWYRSVNTSQLHPHLKFLRVLSSADSLEIADLVHLEIAGLVHLRLLDIICRSNFHSLPLLMLWNLQKLQVGGYSSCEPLDIWRLPHLRNLNMQNITLVPPRSVHHNLESIIFLDYRSCTKELFARIPNLKTLMITGDHTSNPKCKALNWFESLAYLYKLEELQVSDKYLGEEFRAIHSMGIQSLENFLPNLKKLVLVFTCLKWKDVDVVGTLSKLEDLILDRSVIHGRKWEPKDGGFRRLKVLKIFQCGLQCCEATCDHFPILEDLVIGEAKLEEIPSDFADITTLKSIKLFNCSKSVISSAKCIQKEMQEYGNDTFVVDIQG